MNEISIYIHIPFCLSKCSYCDFFSKPVEKDCQQIQYYFPALLNEIDYRISKYNKEITVKSVYIGGGTPSLVPWQNIQIIINHLKNKLNFKSDCEITIEVNPDDVTEQLLKNYEQIGINRISCGIQSMNDNILKKLNRRAGRKENLNALELFSKFWKGKISVDLISGLPGETEENFYKCLEEVISVNPDHISMYSLTIEEGTPLRQSLKKGEIDYDYDFSDELWMKGREILLQNGYVHYEVSNFCKPGFECTHNLTYWNHQDYFGFGAGGTGTFYKNDGSAERFSNKNDIAAYINFWNSETINEADINSVQSVESVTRETSKFEYFMMGFRKLSGIKLTDYEKTFGNSVDSKVLKVFQKWHTDGLMNIENDNYSLNSEGILFLNRLLEEII
ncbi:MAG: radical SAM family heme chaperone HemW [Treponema sp.]|nr:radical SAM family heme chaperone HemW [Treponema sp.]